MLTKRKALTSFVFTVFCLIVTSSNAQLPLQAPNATKLAFDAIQDGKPLGPHTITAAYGRRAQLEYMSDDVKEKSWRIQVLVSPYASEKNPDAVKAHILIAQPIDSNWKVTSESDMVLAPNVPASLEIKGGSNNLIIKVTSFPEFNESAGKVLSDSCPSILAPSVNASLSMNKGAGASKGGVSPQAENCCGGQCTNGQYWRCCGAIACCICDQCCVNGD